MKAIPIILISALFIGCNNGNKVALAICGPLPNRPSIKLTEKHLQQCLTQFEGIPDSYRFVGPNSAYSQASQQARNAIAALKEDGVYQLQPVNSALINEKLIILKNELEIRGNLIGGDRI